MRERNYSKWLSQLLENLEHAGPEGVEALAFIRRRRTRLGIHDQPTGARWTAWGHIELHPRYAELAPTDPYALSLIIHEARHLQQGAWTALSVYGELEAWQLQFRYLKSATGHLHADELRAEILERLMQVPLDWDRDGLEQARSLMQEYAGKAYRIDLLPLYPLPGEILFRITGRRARFRD